MGQKIDNDPLMTSLQGIRMTESFVAKLLRKMAAGKGEFEHLAFAPASTKNIWHAAADIIDGYEQQKSL